jgi:hypothetical protein
VTKIISRILINLVTPKARPKHEPLFNKPAFVNDKNFVAGKTLKLEIGIDFRLSTFYPVRNFPNINNETNFDMAQSHSAQRQTL